ncbi:mRNA-decapping enzyme subunit 2 [Geosmithia morbida]|uniref:mRNA-decapping enzyme subunit 2 n=1 Tax=Geosmithia morbida TaxID=1094350 RepID=A0A9P4YWF3_9HYPO|nr:mRNA-decapping enzyme subunit 2 [Geosmithia morbida]KAF4123280.1 mRNA-decapping enzyme subunit 2 [Geosmithia morbida]
MLNHDMDSTVLVKGWKKGANWSFPRGKINKDEDDLDCAIREVWEETGLDLRAAGLVPEGKPKYIEITMREQQMRLYVFRDVPMDTDFEPQTRKEISKIEWYKLSELPAFRKKGQNQTQADVGNNANKFYMVAPFLVPLKKWVNSQKKNATKKTPVPANANLYPHHPLDEAPIEDDAWAQTTAAPAAPAMDTLEGATSELQRLLKLQPQPVMAQAVQPRTTQEDKASALLSMLKVDNSAPPPPPAQQQQQQHNPNMYPHTPLEMDPGDMAQPPNPHHNTNNLHHPDRVTQPPLHFPLPHVHPVPPPPPHQGFDAPPQAIPLVHTQPLPPQVQRSVLNKSTFQESFAAPAPPPPPPHNNNAYVQPREQAHAGYGHPQSPQAGMSPGGRQKGPLSGPSLALLDAFKRDSPSAQAHEAPRPVAQDAFAQQFPQYPQQPSAPAATGPVPIPLSGPSPAQQSQLRPTELAGSMMQQHRSPMGSMPSINSPDGSHKSNLLEMFKPGSSVTMSPQGMHASPRQGQPQSYGSGPGSEKVLLDTLRGGPQQRLVPQPSGAIAAHLDSFAGQGRAEQPTAALQRAAPMGPRQPSGSMQPGPVRILQRDQTDVGDGLPNRIPSRSPYSSGNYGNYGNYMPQQVPAPMGIGSRSSPSGSQRRGGDRATPQDDKRHLLSLFGNPHQDAGADTGRLSGLSGRTGRQTPISPADQMFLLDYLQSVTKPAH